MYLDFLLHNVVFQSSASKIVCPDEAFPSVGHENLNVLVASSVVCEEE